LNCLGLDINGEPIQKQEKSAIPPPPPAMPEIASNHSQKPQMALPKNLLASIQSTKRNKSEKPQEKEIISKDSSLEIQPESDEKEEIKSSLKSEPVESKKETQVRKISKIAEDTSELEKKANTLLNTIKSELEIGKERTNQAVSSNGKVVQPLQSSGTIAATTETSTLLLDSSFEKDLLDIMGNFGL
jgi:hypothetical protein